MQLNIVILLIVTFVLTSCVSPGYNPRGNSIDQMPMYGGYDRKSNPQLRKADETLIANVTKEFGSRERASQTFIDQGIRYYYVNNFSMAMKRFNQAWLVLPTNPDVFWGFAIVYHDESKNCKSREMFEKALELGLSKPIALADAGRVYTLCAVSDKSLDKKTKNSYINKSDALYKQALSRAPGHSYIYGSRASAYYWRGAYADAWKMVQKQRSLGGTPGAKFINILREKMPEPH